MKTNIISLVIIFIFMNTLVYAQVGIGTTSPHPSAMLDISSNSKGLLAPRMTTLEKLAIPSPSAGLIVYDTTQNRFNYHDGFTWITMEASSFTTNRNNYKIIQNTTDLANELVAGGGTTYKLDTNTLYEVNGTVLINAPIDLNGAYLVGLDTNEDILVNASGGPLFSGNKGGSIRNLTMSGNGNQIFNISATSSAESMIVYNCIFAGASSMGTLNNFGLLFFNICLYEGNTNGYNFSGIGAFFMTNVFWSASNSGTFMNLSGTIGSFQMANGNVVVDAGETGLDVSTNPTIATSAFMTGLSFTGSGTRVNPYTVGTYTVYNFTKNWNVDCPGLSLETDNNSTGSMNLTADLGSGFETVFTTTGAASRQKLVGTTSPTNLYRFTSIGDNRLVYDGVETHYFRVTGSVSFQADVNNAVFVFYIAKGTSGSSTATVIEESRVYRESGSTGDVGAIALVSSVELSPGDFIEVWTERATGGGNVSTVSLNVVID